MVTTSPNVSSTPLNTTQTPELTTPPAASLQPTITSEPTETPQATATTGSFEEWPQDTPAPTIEASLTFSEDGTCVTGINNKEEATYMKIPEGVTEIDAHLFANNSSLHWVEFPSTLKKIVQTLPFLKLLTFNSVGVIRTLTLPSEKSLGPTI